MAEPLSMENEQHILQSTGLEEDEYMLMGSAGPVLSITAAYFVFILWIGPAAMANRKPFELKLVLQAYNIIQILWASYILIQPLMLEGVLTTYMACCRPPGSPMVFHPNITFVTWLYFMCKIVDLLDTVFFVLRKKQRQITFLHVYHHSAMVISSWLYSKYIMDPSFAVLQYLNTAVHLIMYSYYFISSLGPKYAKYIWWKKYMTWLQLSQFVIIIGYTLWFWWYGCEISHKMSMYVVFTVGFLFILFANFYLQTYRKPKNKQT